MIPNYYEFYNPVKINSGEEALETIPYELNMLNAKRPIIITDKGIVNAGLLQVLLDSFADSEITIGAVYDETPSDSSLKIVNLIVELFRTQNCDSIIALGGGSAIDTAKGVNIVLSEERSDLSELMGVDRLSKVQKPFIAIPTTSGTGSETTLVAVITDTERNIKMPFTSYLLLPKVAIIDPRMTLSLPPFITAATGMDALTHAIEAYTCLQKNPVSDAYSWAAISLIRDNLVEAVQNGKNKKARLAMANASMLAGIAFSNSMVGGVHAIGHSVGSVAHVHHGTAMAILLPQLMKYNFDVLKDIYAELLLPLAGADIYANTPIAHRAEKAIETVIQMNIRLNELCKMPIKLSDAGVKESQFEMIAETTLGDGSMIVNPKEITKQDVFTILKNAF